MVVRSARAAVALLLLTTPLAVWGGCMLATDGLSGGTTGSVSAAGSGSTSGAGGAGGAQASSSSGSASSSASSGGGPVLCGETDKLLGCYSFDDSSFTDESGHGADPTLMKGPPVFDTGNPGRAVRFSGLIAKLDAGKPSYSAWQHAEELTIEMWINPSSLPTMGGRAGLLDNEGGYAMFLYGQNSGVNDVLRCVSPGTTLWGNKPVAQGAWTHVACVFAKGQTQNTTVITLYRDGNAEASQTFNQSFSGTDKGVVFGSNEMPDGSDPFDGLVDSLRVFNVARTQPEICKAAGGNGC